MPDQPKLKEEATVSKLVKDPKAPPDTVLLSRFLGNSSVCSANVARVDRIISIDFVWNGQTARQVFLHKQLASSTLTPGWTDTAFSGYCLGAARIKISIQMLSHNNAVGLWRCQTAGK